MEQGVTDWGPHQILWAWVANLTFLRFVKATWQYIQNEDKKKRKNEIKKSKNLFLYHFLYYPHCVLASEKAMASHSSTLAWKIPWTEETGGLQSMGSLRVGHNWWTLLSLFTFLNWRRKWQPTPVFLPGESQGRGSLVGYHLWGRRVRHDWSDLAAAAATIKGKFY